MNPDSWPSLTPLRASSRLVFLSSRPTISLSSNLSMKMHERLESSQGTKVSLNISVTPFFSFKWKTNLYDLVLLHTFYFLPSYFKIRNKINKFVFRFEPDCIWMFYREPLSIHSLHWKGPVLGPWEVARCIAWPRQMSPVAIFFMDI